MDSLTNLTADERTLVAGLDPDDFTTGLARRMKVRAAVQFAMFEFSPDGGHPVADERTSVVLLTSRGTVAAVVSPATWESKKVEMWTRNPAITAATWDGAETLDDYLSDRCKECWEATGQNDPHSPACTIGAAL